MSKKKSAAAVAPVEPVAATPAPEGSEPEVTSEGNSEIADLPTEPTTIVEPTPTPEQTEAQAAAEDDAINDRAVAGNNAVDTKAARAKLMHNVRMFGTQNGQGKKSLVALAEAVCDGAMNGYVLAADAELLYKHFRKHSSSAAGAFAPKDQSDASLRAQVSKLAQFIHIGVESDKYVNGDDTKYMSAWDMLAVVAEKHVQFMDSEDAKNLKTKSTYEALLNAIRFQRSDEAKGVWLSEDQMLATLLNEDTGKATTGLDLLKSALKKLEAAKKGTADTEARAGRAPIEHESVDHAVSHILFALSELDPAFITARNAEIAEAAKKENERIAKNKAA